MDSASPETFSFQAGVSAEQIQEQLLKKHLQWANELYFDYTGSDGTLKRLTIKDILERRENLEMAYNPNDGIEIRWGEEGFFTENMHRAPRDQRLRMEKMRSWFRNRIFTHAASE